jgi:hypothetical protein
MLLSSKKTLNRFFDFGLLTRIHDLDKQSDFGLCVTKIFEPTNDPKSIIPESGKGRGESPYLWGRRAEPRFPNTESGIGNWG